MNKKIVTRFAPSPTGYLHIGGLRTALFNYLWAKHSDGEFRLRIEDTDKRRQVKDAGKQLINLLKDFGITEKGEVIYQSKRAEKKLYKKIAEKLLDQNKAYYCYCSAEDLDLIRKKRIAQKQPPGYDGTCKSISAEDAKKRVTEGESAAIRIKWPDKKDSVITFEDQLHGKVSFKTETLEDTVILKSDDYPTYHLANVVDDHEMGVTHVIRGEEWLPSAPIHALLYEYLGYDKPIFLHLPLILNPDKSKLSKRQGDVSIESYVEKGYLPEAIINYIAFLGWNPGDDRELFNLENLIKEFDLDHINKSGAVFDIQKLNWFNSQYIKKHVAAKNDKNLYKIIKPFLRNTNQEDALKIFALFFERLNYLSELSELSTFLHNLPEYESKLLIFKKSTKKKTIQGLNAAVKKLQNLSGDWKPIDLELALKNVKEETDLTFGDIFWPIRVAVSGLSASPAPTDILSYLGKEESIKRIKKAISSLS